MTEDIGAWVDSLPLSRKKKNLARDFSDGVMMAEVLHVFYPKLVDLHNYDQTLRVDTKIYNWNTLNQKVLKKLGLPLDAPTITAIANAQPGAIDRFLTQTRDFINGRPDTSEPQQSRNQPKAKPKKEKEALPPLPKPMTDEDREVLIEKIREADTQAQLIRALEAKEAKLVELMRVKDAKLMKLKTKK